MTPSAAHRGPAVRDGPLPIVSPAKAALRIPGRIGLAGAEALTILKALAVRAAEVIRC